MQVYKFGGTSLETAHRIRAVRDIVDNEEPKIVVVSANGKSTDQLLQIGNCMMNSNIKVKLTASVELLDYYLRLSGDLFESYAILDEGRKYLKEVFTEIEAIKSLSINESTHKKLVAFGELISSKLLELSFRESGIPCTLMHAPDIISTDENGNVSEAVINDRLTNWMLHNPEPGIIITQGFICSDHKGNINNLGRGGSDYSATLFGVAAGAEQIQIWSDVDGFLSNDPGFVDSPPPLQNLSFDEAAELAYFGARILHPSSLLPARRAGIPVLLKNTLNPAATGTLISTKSQYGLIKAVAAKDNICCITLLSDRMLMAHGFLKRVFAIFDHYKTPVDMVTTSEVSVSVTIDNTIMLENIIAELEELGSVSVLQNQSIICIAGEQLMRNRGEVAGIFGALKEIPVGMISYGASQSSITLLVNSRDKQFALRSLQKLITVHSENTLSYA